MLGNYKIRVNNEAESEEVQELFCVLGASTDSCDRFGIVCLSGGKVYTDRVEFFEDYDDCEEITIPQLREMVSEHRKPKEQGLISGADALRALADGKEVENWNGSVWWDVDKTWQVGAFMANRKFRLKPRTITLNVEIPAPFEPKDGDEVYFIDCDTKRGYSSDVIGQGCDPEWIQFGAWKSEDEIKQVVAALRSALTSK